MTASATSDAPPAEPLCWVKCDLHLHTAEDPLDEIDYTASELLQCAHESGFRALAITLHDRVFDDPAIFAAARGLGILLIRAAELRIEGADVVILNVDAEEAAGIRTFEDLRSLRRRRGDSLLVIAPHPFYRFGGSIGRRLLPLIDCFDAVEHCHFHVPLLNPNGPAARLAAQTQRPLLATSDAHRLRFFGGHYSLLGLTNASCPPRLEEVFAAIRAHRIRRVSPSGGWARLVSLLVFLFMVHPFLTRLPGSKRARARRRQSGGHAGTEVTPRRATA